MIPSIIGWDVGGVNIKAARPVPEAAPRTVLEPFELQRAPERLGLTLAGVAAALEAEPGAHHAVSMTAELSQLFRTKREGVHFVLTALEAAFGADRLHIFGTDGRFHSPDEARRHPLRAAAANWMATALLVARVEPTCLLLDIGSTTTDVIPLQAGAVVARGRSDPERLASGELVYTGALRTPTEAVAHRVPLRDGEARVSAEGFAVMGDVHLWLGVLRAEDYTIPPPDGRPPTKVSAGERLARVVCADRELLDESQIDRIARALADAQIATVADAIRQVCIHRPGLRIAVVTGLGDFIGASAARREGLEVRRLADRLGEGAARTAPAVAVALLLKQFLGHA